MRGSSCEAVQAQLDDLLDDRLPVARAGALTEHVGRCASCTARWRSATAQRAALRGLPPEPLPAGFAERLHRRVVAAAASAPEPPRRFRPAAVLAPLATAALGFLAAAVVAAPLLRSPALPAPTAVQGPEAASATTSLARPAALPDLRPQHAAFGVSAAVIQGPAASDAAGASRTAGGAASRTGAGAMPVRSATPALSVTLVAASPARALARLTEAAAQVGGRVVSEPAGPSGRSASEPRVASLDALVPVAQAAGFVDGISRFGTVLARAGALPAVTSGVPPFVHVLVTVFAPLVTGAGTGAGAAPAPAASTAAGAAQTAVNGGARLRAALLRVAHVAPWAAGAILVAWLSVVVVGRRRRSSWP